MAGYIGSKAVSVNTTSATISDDLAVGDDLTVTDDATIGGTLGVTGVVTANAGVVVDTMTLDAATLTSTGDFTVDAAGDIILDSAGRDWTFKLATTTKFNINDNSDDILFQCMTQDKDLIFQGMDGNTTLFTAFHLEMNNGGRARFFNATSNQVALFKNTAHDAIIQIDATAANKNSIVRFGDNDDNDVGMIDYDHNINDMIITANASECARFISEGGITFNGDTAAANALNDYEEGTWTPAVTSSAGSITTVASPVGTYIKIGTKLTVFFQFTISDLGNASGHLIISAASIPFVEDNTVISYTTGTVRGRSGNNVTVNSGISELDPNGTLNLYGNQTLASLYHGQVTFQTT